MAICNRCNYEHEMGIRDIALKCKAVKSVEFTDGEAIKSITFYEPYNLMIRYAGTITYPVDSPNVVRVGDVVNLPYTVSC